MLKKITLFHALIFLGLSAHATAPVKVMVKDNENIDISLSRSQYNRVYVENDKIITMRYPQTRLSVLEEKDGSWYLDLQDDRPFTLFMMTKKGHHFSATVNNKKSLGQTIALSFARPKRKPLKRLRPTISKKAQYEKTLKALITLTDSQKSDKGKQANAVSKPSYRFYKTLRAKQIVSLSKGGLRGEKYQLTNKGHAPVLLKDEWFKDNDTKALMVKKRTIYPNETISLVRIEKEDQHG